MPAPGRVTKLAMPEGAGVRFDTMLYEGYAVPPFYDSLLGKLIVRRRDAAGRPRPASRRAGRPDDRGHPDDRRPASRACSTTQSVKRGAVHTRWLEGWLATAH